VTTSSTLPSGESGTVYCARHPHVETFLRCGRCFTPICPRCLVSTPVGARCPTCAQVKRFATLLKPAELGRAIGYGVLLGAVGTVVLTLIPFLGLIGYAILGFGVGEVVSIGVNRKRSRELAPIAVACLFVGFEVGLVAYIVFQGAPFGVDVLLAPILLLTRGLSLLLGLLIGALLAWMRVR
jgi:hypothetical protein